LARTLPVLGIGSTLPRRPGKVLLDPVVRSGGDVRRSWSRAIRSPTWFAGRGRLSPPGWPLPAPTPVLSSPPPTTRFGGRDSDGPRTEV